MSAAQFYSGTGSPNGSVTGNPGDLYLDESGVAAYFKTSGVGTNTGWTALGAGASFPDITDTAGVQVRVAQNPAVPGSPFSFEMDTTTLGTSFFIIDSGTQVRAEMKPGTRFDTGIGFGNVTTTNLVAGDNTGVLVPTTVNNFNTPGGDAFLDGIQVPSDAFNFASTGAKFVWIVNRGPNNLQINDQSPFEPLATNRFILPGGAAITLRPNGAALVANLPMVPGTRWVCLGFNA